MAQLLPIDNFERIYIKTLELINNRPEFIGTGRGKEFKEITDFSFSLTNPYDRFVWNAARRANYEFAMKFFLWIISGSNDYDFVKGVNPNAANYIDKTKQEDPKQARFSTAYGPRIVPQIPKVIEELVKNPGSRRAVISILDSQDLDMLDKDTKEEFPCTESLTFLIRHNKLHCYTQMRSNNMCTTVVYDVFVFTMIQEFILNQLRSEFPTLEMGTYHHHCTSAHFFSEQQEFVDRILSSEEKMLFRSDAK